MNGRVYLIDKSAGTGSTDVVRTLRRRLQTARVGHCGTLDPDATGLLIVCVDEATKLVPWLTAESKAYRVTARLGTATTTDDAAGTVTAAAPADHVTREALAEALDREVGDREQLPPDVSAIRVDGRRLYDRVYAGESVEGLASPRPVRLDRAELIRFDWPEFELELDVSKGYYVRSLVRDLGVALGTRAHVTALRRHRVGSFDIGESVLLDDLTDTSGLTADEAILRVLPCIDADGDLARRVGFGHRILLADVPFQCPTGPFLVRSPERLLAVVHVNEGHLIVIRGL